MERTFTYTENELKEKSRQVFAYAGLSLMFLGMEKDKEKKEERLEKIIQEIHEILMEK